MKPKNVQSKDQLNIVDVCLLKQLSFYERVISSGRVCVRACVC